MIFSITIRKKYLYGAFKIIFSPETFSTLLGHTGDNLERRFRRHLDGRGLINIISLDVTSFNSAVTLKLKCGKVVCVEIFIFGDRSSVAYRVAENLSRFIYSYHYDKACKIILLKKKRKKKIDCTLMFVCIKLHSLP